MRLKKDGSGPPKMSPPLDRVGKLDRVWLLPVYSFSSATA